MASRKRQRVTEDQLASLRCLSQDERRLCFLGLQANLEPSTKKAAIANGARAAKLGRALEGVDAYAKMGDWDTGVRPVTRVAGFQLTPLGECFQLTPQDCTQGLRMLPTHKPSHGEQQMFGSADEMWKAPHANCYLAGNRPARGGHTALGTANSPIMEQNPGLRLVQKSTALVSEATRLGVSITRNVIKHMRRPTQRHQDFIGGVYHAEETTDPLVLLRSIIKPGGGALALQIGDGPLVYVPVAPHAVLLMAAESGGHGQAWRIAELEGRVVTGPLTHGAAQPRDGEVFWSWVVDVGGASLDVIRGLFAGPVGK